MVSIQDIHAARRRIRSSVIHTPLVRSARLSEVQGADVYLKLETTQEIGAFKIRGATNRIATMTATQRQTGVVTVSTGNHGRAVAAAAAKLGIRAVVCMSNLVPDNKRQSIEALGAEILITGQSQDEAEIDANRLVGDEGLTLVHPFDDADVIAGQGTIGLEILEDLPAVDTVVAGLSGGGLLGGMAVAVKSVNPGARAIGVSMEKGPAMVRSLEAGEPVAVAEQASLADSLGGGIGLYNRHSFELVRRLVDDTVLASEAEIADGMRHLYYHEGIVAEGAGAIGVGALLHGKLEAAGDKLVIVISGRNVDMQVFSSVVHGR